MGLAPAMLLASPRPLMAGQRVAATVADHVPMVNVTPFGLCRSIANPLVAAATAAASGTLTPVPCVPMTPAPWAPGATTATVAGVPALPDNATLSCLWSGTISIVAAGQTTVTLP